MRPPFSRVTDIGIIRVENGREVERFQSLLNPGTSIPHFIQRLTGITDADVASAPSFEEIALQVKELLDGAVFVAHNAAFDYGFIKSEFERIGMEFSSERLCSVQLSRALYPKAKSHNLDSVSDRHGLRIQGDRHRALPDADLVWQFFQDIEKHESPEKVAEAISQVRTFGGARARAFGKRKNPAIARDTFSELPDSAGVYFFYGPEQELLYVGKSKHLRTRARSHFHASSNSKERILQNDTASIRTVKTSGELSALILESLLIKEENPIYNRALRKRKKLATIRTQKNATGYDTMLIDRTDALMPDESVLGVFRTTTQAKTKLRELSKEHKLCPRLMGVESGSGACFASQLQACSGACTGKVSADEYNTLLQEVFASRRMKTWPYRGVVMIDEKESSEAGTVFFIDNWTLQAAYRYENEDFSPFSNSLPTDGLFDYDTYKILTRFLLSPKNRRTITVLSPAEYARTLARCTGSHEAEIAFEPEFVIS